MQNPSNNDTPFSLPHDTPEITPIDYPDYDSSLDAHEVYDEGLDDSIDNNPYEYDDDPIKSAKRLMQRGIGTTEHTTTEQSVIRRWVEERVGYPSHIKGVDNGLDRGGLYVAFYDTEPDIDIETISWTAFFDIFTKNKLAFVYRNKTRTGEISKFYLLKYTPEAYD